MTRRAGSADLPLHGGYVLKWLADRMTRLGTVISEAIIHRFGRDSDARAHTSDRGEGPAEAQASPGAAHASGGAGAGSFAWRCCQAARMLRSIMGISERRTR
jgi:hypothetical protein